MKKGAQMTPQEMWNKYKQINPSIGDEIDAWTFRKSGIWKSKITLASMAFAMRKENYSALRKQEALINIVLIYRVVVRNSVRG